MDKRDSAADERDASQLFDHDTTERILSLGLDKSIKTVEREVQVPNVYTSSTRIIRKFQGEEKEISVDDESHSIASDPRSVGYSNLHRCLFATTISDWIGCLVFHTADAGEFEF